MARKFAQSELAPVAAELDKGNDGTTFLGNLSKLAELGFMGMNTSADHGGTEAGAVAFSVAVTEIARACASTAVTMSVTNMVGEVIQLIGSEEQKTRYCITIHFFRIPADARVDVGIVDPGRGHLDQYFTRAR